MTRSGTTVARPQRWETPFGSEMTEAAVDQLLQTQPFADMDAKRFPATVPLRGILRNDTRLVTLNHGDVVIREGDYGSSAFLVVRGRVRVVLKNLPRQMLGREPVRRQGWFETLWRSWRSPAFAEIRRRATGLSRQSLDVAHRQRIFLQDIPDVLDADDSIVLNEGQVFGEIAALSRTPRTATVLSEGESTLLEVRWQGLRDLMRVDTSWRQHVDRLYRDNSLRSHLRETPLLARLAPDQLQQLADATQFASYGHFEWHHKFREIAKADPKQRLQMEPLIAEQGDYPDGLMLIRGGFARLSIKHGDGEKTIAYLGKGDVFGFDDLARNWLNGDSRGWSASLRAIGYVDVLRIPVPFVEQIILPSIPTDELPTTGLRTHSVERSAAVNVLKANSPGDAGGGTTIDPPLLEFLVDQRLNNGTQAMVIDLDRCTRCDDCIRACAATHDGNPRFNREGPRFGELMFTQACLHCADPVCMIGCPTGAIARDQATGLVLINDGTCIGCQTCANSCPYQNIKMVEIRDAAGNLFLDNQELPLLKATKCDLCVGQIAGPACQRACAHDALIRLDLRDPRDLTKWRS